MDKSYSILILPRQGTGTKHLVVSRRSIQILAGTVLTLLGLGGWLLGDYFRIKLERDDLNIQGAQLKKEVATLSTRLKEELAAMNAKHREELLVLHERAKATQQLLITWKGLRKRIQDSLPPKHRSSLTGQRIVGELETILSSLEDELKGLIASMPSEWPAKGWLSSRYGRRRSPWTGKVEFHSGTDIANRRGTPVYAPGDAVVGFAGRNGSNGKTIVLKHGQGITTHYGHLSKIYVKKGDRVRKNRKIANLGNTGKSTNPHLHYEVRVEGIPIDPRQHLLKRSLPSS